MKTTINEDINRHVNGYMVNTVPSTANRQKVADFQAKLDARFGKGLWLDTTSQTPEELAKTLVSAIRHTWGGSMPDTQKKPQQPKPYFVLCSCCASRSI